jgi:hypothetical protein
MRHGTIARAARPPRLQVAREEGAQADRNGKPCEPASSLPHATAWPGAPATAGCWLEEWDDTNAAAGVALVLQPPRWRAQPPPSHATPHRATPHDAQAAPQYQQASPVAVGNGTEGGPVPCNRYVARESRLGGQRWLVVDTQTDKVLCLGRQPTMRAMAAHLNGSPGPQMGTSAGRTA